MTDGYEKSARIPAPPEGSMFSVLGIRGVSMPHPYCITPKHVAWASDHWSGMLSEAAIQDSESKGKARCGMRGCNLGYEEHRVQKTLFIEVPQNRDLNAVPGLHAYLLSIKSTAMQEGVDGFAFPAGRTQTNEERR
jgi:hypothetical protein